MRTAPSRATTTRTTTTTTTSIPKTTTSERLKSSDLRLTRRDAAAAFLSIVSYAALASACGGKHEAESPPAPPKLPPLKLAPLGEIVAAPGLEVLVCLEPKTIAAAPETALAVGELFSQERFAAFADRYGADVRSLDEVVVASYKESLLAIARGFLDPGKVEAAFAKRTIVDERLIDGNNLVHVAAHGASGSERLVVMGPLAAALERGKPGPLRAAEAFALGKLKRARPALAAEPLASAAKILGAFPARAFFPGPFQDEWARAAGGLLQTSTAAAIGARPAAGPEPGARIEAVLVVTGTFNDAEGAKARLGAAIDRLLVSDIGRLLGTDHLAEPLRVDVLEGEPAGLRARAVMRAMPLFKGLYDATAASGAEIFRR